MDYYIQLPAPAGSGGVSSINTQTGAITITGAGGTTVTNIGNAFTITSTTSGTITNRTVTTSGNIISGDNGQLILCNQSAAITLTMPAHSAGFNVWIKDISGAATTNPITIARNGGTGTFEAVASDKLLQTNFGIFRVYDDGTNYWLMGV